MTVQTSRSLLEIVVPVADYQDVEQTVARHAPRLGGIRGKTAVLLPSEKSSSPPFMRALMQRLTAETAAQRVYMHHAEWAFFHPTRAATIAPEIDRLAGECDLMVSGVAY